MTSSSPRLSPDDWLRAGFQALVDAGPGALRAEPLARSLGATKGSFYWHFKDVPTFKAALAAHWRAAALAALQSAAEADATPTERLYRIARITAPEDEAHGGAAVEAAMRGWALVDHTVADAMTEIDAARIAYLSAVLSGLDLGNPELARLVYGAHIGMGFLAANDGIDNAGALSTLMAALTALREA